MFSIFEYFRRRTCDSILAGAYDAAEILDQQPIDEPADKPDGNTLPAGNASTPATPVETPKKIGALPSPPPRSAGDLFSQEPPANEAPLPPRKRGRPRKDPPQAPSQP